MNVEVEKQNNGYCRLIVTLSVEEVGQAYQQATRNVSRSARLPGFRPGKAPPALLERHMRPQIEQEAVDRVLDTTLAAAIAQANVSPIDRPVLESVSLKRGASGRYAVSLELYPEVGPIDYERLQAVRYEPKVAEEAIDKRLQSEQKKQAQTVPCTERNVVQLGDYVQLDYQGSLDGAPIKEAISEDTLIHVQKGQFVPGFVEALVGQQVPGQTQADIVFPTNYDHARLAGKSVHFEFTLHELKVEQLPALDDDFAKDCGHESLAAMRQAIRDELHKDASEGAEQSTDKALLQALVQRNPIEVSDGMLQRQIEGMIRDRQERLQQMLRQKYTFDANELADLRTELREQAQFIVRSGILTEALLKQQNIVLDEAALAGYLDEMRQDKAPNVFGSLDALEQLHEREEVRDQLLSLLGRRKAIALLKQSAEWLAEPAEAKSEEASAT